MFLPQKTGLDFPLVPPLDKTLIANLSVALLCMMVFRTGLKIFPRSGVGKLLVVMFVSTPFLTVMTNPDPIYTGFFTLPGLKLHDSFSLLVRQTILILPFFIGRQFLADENAHRTLLWALVAACLVYSLPMLLEIRLSPQLHIWVYGVFPHNFAQMVRFGGFRPVVFMGHGLLVAAFCAVAVVAAAAAWRERKRIMGIQPGFITIYLTGVLILCKSVGPLILAGIGVLLVRFSSVRLQLFFCAFAAVVVLSYPALRGGGVIPTNQIASLANSINAERGESLTFRFNNEDLLLDKASRRPIFGWGSFGRHNVYSTITGKTLSVVDGRWVGTIATWGWYGYIAEFGLLTLPLFLIWRKAKRRAVIATTTIALCVIYSLNLLDLLPNASITPITFLVAGALLGYAEKRE